MTPTGVSDYMRHVRELQSVECHVCFAFDHCFATGKTYSDKNIKATWTATNENGEVMMVVGVTKTTQQEAAHGAEQLVRRQGFKPKVLYSDIWPNGKKFWSMLMGDDIKGRLGLFHFLQRIIRTLRDNHSLYHEALRELKKAVYRYDDQDLNDLLVQIREGNVGLPDNASRASKSYTALHLNSLMYTSQWKQRYDDFLKKIILPGQLIDENLNKWFGKYKGQRCERTDSLLFTKDTRKTVDEQCRKGQYLADVLPVEEMYNEQRATKRMKHGLSFKRSCRGESHVESAQGQQQHYGNGGMNSDRADDFILRGHARANTRKREKLEWNKGEGEWRDKTQAWLRGTPIFYDHLRMAKINEEAAGCIEGWVPFNNIFVVKEDNGERFLSDYFYAQQKRETKYNSTGRVRLTERCPCVECAQAIEPLPHHKRAGVTVQDAAIGLGDDEPLSFSDVEGGPAGWPSSQGDWPHQSNDDLLNSSMIQDEEEPLVLPQEIDHMSEPGGPMLCQPVQVAATARRPVPPTKTSPVPFGGTMGGTMGMGMGPMGMGPMGMGMGMQPMGMMLMQQQMQHKQDMEKIQAQMQMQAMQMQLFMQNGGRHGRRQRKAPHIDNCCDVYVQDRIDNKPGRPRHSIDCPHK